jgi:probable F420-dependent oxidoreductase
MQFGLYLNTQAPPRGEGLRRVYDELFETVELAEEVGFDACFLPEHHQQPDGYLPAPFVMGGAIAARTSRLHINTGVMLLALWHPLRVAEDVAVLDVLSNGRVGLGVGLGLVEREFHQFGVDRRSAVSRFEEEIALLRLAWTEERFSFQGRHFQLHDLGVTPKPIQQPPPIWIGAMSDRGVARAGRLGDGWLTDPLHNLETMAAWARLYREAAARHGRKPWIWLQRDIWVTEDPGEVERVWAPHLVADWRFYFNLGFFRSGRFNPSREAWITQISSADEIEFERIRHERVIAGTPDQVIAQLDRWREVVQPDGLCFRFRFPNGPDQRRTAAAIRLFGREVIPHFQRVASFQGGSVR